MSKNTASSAFRKIDVDAFNEDNFRDEDNNSGSAAGQTTAPSGGGSLTDAAALTSMLQSGKNVDALKAVLSQAPLGNKNQNEKVRIGCCS